MPRAKPKINNKNLAKWRERWGGKPEAVAEITDHMDATLFQAVVVEGKTLQTVAGDAGVSRERVRQRLARAARQVDAAEGIPDAE